MGHSLRNTNLTISGTFSIQDGTENQGYILVSDERGRAEWKDPASYISARPDGHYIGELFGGGVVVSVWRQQDGTEKCLIAAPENISYTSVSNGITIFRYGLSWSSATVPSASSLGFGATNSETIATADPTSAAKKCIDYINPNLGTGIWDDWFLPSIEELGHLMNNSAIFNKVLESYANDNSKSLLDKVYTSYSIRFPFPPGTPPITTYYTDSISPTDINLVRFGNTRWDIYETMRFTDEPYYFKERRISDDKGWYLSSTNALGGDGCLATSVNGPVENLTPSLKGLYYEEAFAKSLLGKVRPFRIGDDTQTSIVFDADWAILTYVFGSENDLDTRTTMITPYRTDSQRGYGSNAYRSWAPAGINSPSTGPITPNVPADGLAANGTFSVLWHAGDNTGIGYETVLISINAFKYYFPGQSEIEIDTRAHWFVANFGQSGEGYTGNLPWNSTSLAPPSGYGITQRERLERTDPVVMKIDLYKGGTASKNPTNSFQWIVSGYSASYSVGSYGKLVNDVYPGYAIDGVTTTNQSSYPSGVRVARFKYNVVGKFGKIIID